MYCQKDGKKWSLVMGNTLIEMFSFLIRILIKFFFVKNSENFLEDPLQMTPILNFVIE